MHENTRNTPADARFRDHKANLETWAPQWWWYRLTTSITWLQLVTRGPRPRSGVIHTVSITIFGAGNERCPMPRIGPSTRQPLSKRHGYDPHRFFTRRWSIRKNSKYDSDYSKPMCFQPRYTTRTSSPALTSTHIPNPTVGRKASPQLDGDSGPLSHQHTRWPNVTKTIDKLFDLNICEYVLIAINKAGAKGLNITKGSRR